MSRRIFLSAASSEFGPLRLKLAALLLRSGINVEHQDIFPQTASDLVRKLGALVRECSLVVHIVGHFPGSVASPTAVVDLLDDVPRRDFLRRFPQLQHELGDLSGITYTQWEAFLALHYGIPVLLYAPSDACDPAIKTVKADFVQKQHLDHLRIVGRHPEFCADESEFVGKILADVYRHFGLPTDGAPSAIPSYLPERNPHFRGRKTDLARLRAALERFSTIGITQQVAVFASGGEAQCAPSVVTFNTLLSKAGTYEEALAIVEQMWEAKCEPSVFTLNTLMSKKEGLPPVGEVLRWYYGFKYHPSEPLNALIGSLKKLNRQEEALTIALQHPQLAVAQRLMRDASESARAFFQSAKAADSGHPTADFALGILAVEINRPDEARAHLVEARRRAVHPRQMKTIDAMLNRL